MRETILRVWRGFSTYQRILLGVVAAAWVLLAINPRERENWLLENLLVALFVPAFIAASRYFRLSDFSYTLLALFMILHLVGAHYSYSHVPAGEWLGRWAGDGRNHYDRLVHFAFGFLLAYPVREVFLRIAAVRGLWGFLLPLELTLSLSALYEIIEWAVAALIAPEMGPAFLGTQGDPWDAQKDMALAGLGALLTMLAVAGVNWWYDEAFWKEMGDSLRVKDHQPLGEERLRELIRARHRAAERPATPKGRTRRRKRP